MSKRRHTSATASRPSNQLRIIGGQWRGRKLSFPNVEGLRPTPDRVRETLFNWLAGVIPGAHCLDLFAGSGALGLEALSRGAASVTLVDSSADAANQLRNNLQLLAATEAHVVLQPAQTWLQTTGQTSYDVVFLDPPFGKGLADQAIAALNRNHLLNSDAWVYLEVGIDEEEPTVPAHWQPYREKQAGQVSYRLFHVLADA